ncbi:MAG: M48 family metallopeptidase [FCB group bacterium]|jgi:heat shock protein HtpX|nr:M48 family metallopeptidase [FCB group bacterium]
MWEQIRANKRKSAVLIVIVAALLFALGFAIGESVEPGAGLFGLMIAGIVWFFMTLTAYFQGDSILLSVSGARRIEHKDHPRLFNIVEEMSIAAGLPRMPDVYIIEDTAMNAFATGRKPNCSAVAITTGLLERLNRDQLQGVIAHEMSHVVNRDVLFMMLVGVMVGSIVLISDAFLRGMFRSGRYTHSRSRKGGGNAIMLILAIVLAILAPFLAQLVYLAASRRREYLADAHAAVLTRYPEGLAGALEVLANDTMPVATANRATAPMYIINPMRARGGEGSGWFSTHPPTFERIRILRGMAGAASFNEYQRAWREVDGKNAGQLPGSALAAAGAVPIRAPLPDMDTPAARRHTGGDAIRRAERYAFLSCPCGLRLKIPPDFKGGAIECPRCHRSLPAVTG